MDRKDLNLRIPEISGRVAYTEDSLVFYLKGKEVGRGDLPEFSTMEIRHMIAELALVKEYDDFAFVKKDKSIRLKGFKTFRDALTTQQDINVDIGKYEGIHYQFYKNKANCPHCGAVNYLAKYPEQKHLVEQLRK